MLMCFDDTIILFKSASDKGVRVRENMFKLPNKFVWNVLTSGRIYSIINPVVKEDDFTERSEGMKSDTFHMSMLFDFYGDLLTEKQKELFDLYYNEDLSLTEIAEHAEISRQGVRDAIIRAETILRDTEDKVGLVKKYSGYEDKLIKIREEVGYIIRVNSGLKNYEIAKRTESIVDIIDELLK